MEVEMSVENKYGRMEFQVSDICDFAIDAYPRARRCSLCQKRMTYLNPDTMCFACQRAKAEKAPMRTDVKLFSIPKPRRRPENIPDDAEMTMERDPPL